MGRRFSHRARRGEPRRSGNAARSRANLRLGIIWGGRPAEFHWFCAAPGDANLPSRLSSASFRDVAASHEHQDSCWIAMSRHRGCPREVNMMRFWRPAALTVVIGLAFGGAPVAAVSAAASSSPSPALVAAEISPAVDQAVTKFSATVLVPLPQVRQAAFDALAHRLIREQEDGQLGTSLQAFGEQFAHAQAVNPNMYWAPGTVESVNARLDALCTGWFITPTGYMISAAHCVDKKDPSIAVALVESVLPPFISEFKQAAATGFRRAGVPMNQQINRDLRSMETKWFHSNTQIMDMQTSSRVALAVKGRNGQRASQMLPASVVAAGSVYPGRDYALFKVPGYTNLPTLPLGKANPQVGDNLYVDGFPGTVTGNNSFTAQSQAAPTFTSGLLSAYRTSVNHVPYLQTQAPAFHGNPGGPVLDTQGNVIGTLIAGASAGDQVVAGYQFVLPVGIIRSVLAEHGIRPSAGPVTSQYDAALADYYRGYYKRARPEFQAVLAAFPQHPYAASYIRLSQRQIAEGHDRTPSFPWLLPFIALAVLAAAGGAVLWARGRRLRPSGPATAPPATVPYGQPLPWPPPGWQAPQLGDDPGWPPAH